MKTTLIFTVLNEGRSVPALLDTIAAQTRPPDEVVVCDGGSRDDTVAILRGDGRLNLRVIESPGANISRGRNIAIAAATGEVIACTDAGVRLDERWLEKLTEPFRTSDHVSRSSSRFAERAASLGGSPIGGDSDPDSRIQDPHSVAGFFVPDPRTTFEVAMGATVLPELSDVRPGAFLPSSRSVAYLKSAWQAVDGYPEWLDYCEDVIFDLKLREACGPFTFAPEAIAYFRPRGSLRSFFRQYYLYARGDGKADLFLRRHLIRYAIYLVALPVLLVGILLGTLPLKLLCLGLLVAGVAAYTRAPYRRLAHQARDLPLIERIRAAALVPVIRVVGDVAKMIGYPVGLMWRLKHRTGDHPSS
jgi:glycosyltransferase involved in cell wall biosynthesis